MTKSTELLKQTKQCQMGGIQALRRINRNMANVMCSTLEHNLPRLRCWFERVVGVWAEDNDTLINGTVNTAKRDIFHHDAQQSLVRQRHNRSSCEDPPALLHNVMRLPCAFFDITPVGRVLGRFSQDINGVDMRLPNAVQMLMGTLCGYDSEKKVDVTRAVSTLPLYQVDG
nr:unnamed protein product [Callosobruchus analis]